MNLSFDSVYEVHSQRFGHALGVNFLGQSGKVCSYDCAYCEFGTTKLRMNEIKKGDLFPAVDLLTATLQNGFATKKASGYAPNTILILGPGESTLHPEFDTLSELVKSLRDQHFNNTPIILSTNGSNLDSRKVLKGVQSIDKTLFKLDAGNDKVLKSVNDPLVKDSIEKLITNARRIKGVAVQSTFVQGAVDNTKNEDIEEWIEAIGMIKPDEVFLHTLHYVPSKHGIKKVEEDTLYTIQAKLEKKTRIKAKVFYT